MQINRNRSPRMENILIPLIFSHVIIATNAALIFSPLGWSSLLNFQGNFYPEPIFLISGIIVVFSSHRYALVVRSACFSLTFLSTFIGLLLLLLIGFIFHHNLLAAYSDFRPCILLAFGFSIFTVEPIELKIDAGKLAFWFNFYIMLSNIFSNVFLPETSSSIKVVYPILSSVYCVFFCLRYKKIAMNDYMLYLSVACGCFMAISSFYRAFYFCALVILIISFIHSIASIVLPNRPVNSRVAGILLLSSAILAMSAGDFISSRVYNYLTSSEDRYIQSVGKMNDIIATLGGESSPGTETTRGMYYSYIWNHFAEFMLPSGLGQKAIEGNWRSQWIPDSQNSDVLRGDTFSSKDGGAVYMATQFGIVISTFLFLYYITSTLKADVKLRWFEFPGFSYMRVTRLFLIIPVLFLFIITGAMFVQIAFSFTFGCCLGLIAFWRSYGLDYAPDD